MSQSCADCIWHAEGECICNVWDMSILCPKLIGNVDDQEDDHECLEKWRREYENHD